MPVKEFPCGHCGKVFSQIGNLQRHVAVMHEDPKLQCAECPLMFHHKRELTRHSWSHGPPQFPCTQCDQAFRNPDQLENHVQVHHINFFLESKANIFVWWRLIMKRRRQCFVVKNVTESFRPSLVCEFIWATSIWGKWVSIPAICVKRYLLLQTNKTLASRPFRWAKDTFLEFRS